MESWELDLFIDLYISAKRKYMNNKWLKPPKEGTRKYDALVKAAELCKQLRTDPLDFIAWNIRRLAPIRIFPEPETMVSDKAIIKYRLHQGMAGIEEADTYSRRGNAVMIKPTYQEVTMQDIREPTAKDPVVIYVRWLSENKDKLTGEGQVEDAIKKCHYVIAKASFLFNNELLDLAKELLRCLEEERCE